MDLKSQMTSRRSLSLRHKPRHQSESNSTRSSVSSTATLKYSRRRTFASDSISSNKYIGDYSSGSSSALTSHASTTSLASDITDDIPPEARPAHSSLPHVGFSARNHQWNNVQGSILSIFHSCRTKESLPMYKITFLINEIRELNKTEIGPFIYDYYKNQLLQKGFRSIRESIKKDVDEGGVMLNRLGETWDFFFKEVLPRLKFVLSSVQIKDLSIHQVTLVAFRDHLLLKTDIEDHLQEKGENVPATIRQMLLVLQTVCETTPPSDNFLWLESLVALVVNPYLGYEGIYMGGQTPAIPAERQVLFRLNSSVRRRKNIEKVGRSISVYVEDLSSDDPPEIIHGTNGSRIPHNILDRLAPLREDDISLRRHSASDISWN